MTKRLLLELLVLAIGGSGVTCAAGCSVRDQGAWSFGVDGVAKVSETHDVSVQVTIDAPFLRITGRSTVQDKP
jgi:hypothetical protein